MSRVKLSELTKYDFFYYMTVQARDENSAGHLDHAALVGIIHDARATIFHSLGMKESNISDGHIGIIMADLIVNYKAEVFAFEKLTVEMHFGEFDEKSFRIFSRVLKDEGEQLVALVETGFVIYDYLKKSIACMPESFARTIASARGK